MIDAEVHDGFHYVVLDERRRRKHRDAVADSAMPGVRCRTIPIESQYCASMRPVEVL
jgi:hypothetical protein